MQKPTMSAKRAWLLSIFVGAAATGCAVIVGADGYSVDKGSGSTGSGGSQGSGATGGAGGSTGGSGGSGGTTGGKGGTPNPDGGPPATGPGEQLCTAAMNMCPPGQSCLTTAFSPPGICTVSCDTVACDANHDCVHSNRPEDMFPNSCVKKCPTGVTCGAGFLCVPISTGPVCLPLNWFDGLGIGDDCFDDRQCASGTCRKPGGWCTKPCGAADPLCAHDAQNFPNRNNEVNWCVTNAGSLSCVPGCDDFGATTCALYPGTTCRSIVDVTMTAAKACLP